MIAVTLVQILSLATGGVIEGFADGFNRARESGASDVSADDVRRAIQTWWVVVLAGAVPVLALWSRLLLRRAGLTLAEHLTFWLHLLGQSALGIGLAFGVTMLIWHTVDVGADVVGTVLLAASLALLLWASVGVFRRGPVWSPLAASLSVLLGYAVYGVAVILVAMIATGSF